MIDFRWEITVIMAMSIDRMQKQRSHPLYERREGKREREEKQKFLPLKYASVCA